MKKILCVIILILINIVSVNECKATGDIGSIDWGVYLMSESLLNSNAKKEFNNDYDTWVNFVDDFRNYARFNMGLGINLLDESDACIHFQRYLNPGTVTQHVQKINDDRQQNGLGTVEAKKIIVYKTVQDPETGTNKQVVTQPLQYFYTYWDNEKNAYYTKEQYNAVENETPTGTLSWGMRLVKKSFVIADDANLSVEEAKIATAYRWMKQGEFTLEIGERYFDENDYYKNYFSTNLKATLPVHIDNVNNYRTKNGKGLVEKRRIVIYSLDDNHHDRETGQYFDTYWDNETNNFYTLEQYNNPDYAQTDTYGVWGAATSWFGEAKGSYTLPEQVNDIIDVFSDMINIVGTTIIVIATIVLGIKYMIGTVDSKTSAKEGLITLLVACVFFFGWTSISNLLFPNNNFIFTSSSDISYEQMVGRIFSTFTYIAQFVAVGVIIFIGIKYIFAGADGRSELKGKSIYFIIGIILVFATTNVLSFISKIINEAL